MLELRDIQKVYRMGDTELQVLKGVSLSIEEGDYVAIMGPSGSGKSTLMHILGLLDVPSSGSYQVDGIEVAHLSEDTLAIHRRDLIGFIFQQFNLLPRVNATENVALPLLYSKDKNTVSGAQKLLAAVGLGDRSEHKPNELSGGQQQRVAIARSLINKPRVILADEPTGNLDSKSEKEILEILKNLNDQGITVVIVTHEEEVGSQAKRLIRMRDGLVQSDTRQRDIHQKTKAETSSKPAVAKESYWWQDILVYFKQGFKTLLANKIRTGLSMLGILIGVAAVVAVLALGNGAQKAIEAQLSALGSNLLVLRSGSVRIAGVSQGTSSVARLDLDDAQIIREKIEEAKDVAPNVTGNVQATFQNKNWSTSAQGSASSYERIHSAKPTIGRFFSDDENQQRARVAVLGTTVVRELFGEQNPIGEMIKINKINFRVIGVLPAKGAGGWRDQDDVIVVPVNTAMFRLLGKQHVDSIEIEIKNANEIDAAQDKILELVTSRHRVPTSQRDSAFDVRNMADIQNALSETSKTMSLLLSSIAAISLIVGGIGIMNIMLVSVTERTKEIGLRKAVGAMRKDILSQFLAESVVISATGGLFGIILGWVITESAAQISGWNMSISLNSILLSFFFSASIGIIFGIYPARKASKLHPIEALRYE